MPKRTSVRLAARVVLVDLDRQHVIARRQRRRIQLGEAAVNGVVHAERRRSRVWWARPRPSDTATTRSAIGVNSTPLR